MSAALLLAALFEAAAPWELQATTRVWFPDIDVYLGVGQRLGPMEQPGVRSARLTLGVGALTERGFFTVGVAGELSVRTDELGAAERPTVGLTVAMIDMLTLPTLRAQLRGALDTAGGVVISGELGFLLLVVELRYRAVPGDLALLGGLHLPLGALLRFILFPVPD